MGVRFPHAGPVVCEYGEIGRHKRLKISRLGVLVRFRLLAPSFRADSLMVKQPTHNRLSESSILSQPTKFFKECVVRKLDLEEVRQFIEEQTPETKIYIGCDSERFNIGGLWYADYVLAIVVHINGNNGCKLFGEVQRERDYDQKVNRPRYRLMNEVYKLSE